MAPYEVWFTRSLTQFKYDGLLECVPVAIFFTFFADLAVRDTTHSLAARLACAALMLTFMTRYYWRTVARLVLTDTTLEIDCPTHRVCFAAEQIAGIRVLSDRGGGQPFSRIHLKPRHGWRQIYHCQHKTLRVRTRTAGSATRPRDQGALVDNHPLVRDDVREIGILVRSEECRVG